HRPPPPAEDQPHWIRYATGDPGPVTGLAPALSDVAATLALGRRTFAHRAAVVAADLPAALSALDVLLDSGARIAGDGGPLRETAAEWVAGRDVDWHALHPEGTVRRTGLPTYPFQRRRHWIDPVQRGPR
ncbi:KS-MAT linker domain-containing protein, partial [Micromonospora tulbaghiae]|uniref:KS-MAT linker domain-containing protein n=1 Tax=Micromonospora tulbaghiae TaxID=479978 RepID=UPI003477D661